MPSSLSRVAINAPLQYSPLSQALAERLPVYQLVGIVNQGAESSGAQSGNQLLGQDDTLSEQTVVLILQPEKFERRLLSVFSTGQVAEYELVYTIDYEVIFPNKLGIRNSLTVSREYQDDPDQILAKSRELNLILGELRTESADRLIRLLSSQYNQSVVVSSNNQGSINISSNNGTDS